MLTATLLLSLSAQANDVDLLDTLSQDAPNVVRGTIVATETTGRGTASRTEYSVQVDRTYRGNAPESFSLSLPGGTYEGVTWQPTGVPTWSAGQQIMVFLRDDGTVAKEGMFTLEHGVLLDTTEERVIRLHDVVNHDWN